MNDYFVIFRFGKKYVFLISSSLSSFINKIESGLSLPTLIIPSMLLGNAETLSKSKDKQSICFFWNKKIRGFCLLTTIRFFMVITNSSLNSTLFSVFLYIFVPNFFIATKMNGIVKLSLNARTCYAPRIFFDA